MEAILWPLAAWGAFSIGRAAVRTWRRWMVERRAAGQTVTETTRRRLA